MRLQGAYVVLATAAVTAVFTVSLLAPNGVGAVDAAATIKPLIPQPRLESQGCGFVLKTDKPDYEAGDRPSIEVTASNPADGKAVATKVWVNISARAPESLQSRMLPIPETLWSHPYVFDLKPGASKALTIRSDIKLPAGKVISISITGNEQTILATSVSTRKADGLKGQNPPAQTAGL